MNKKKSIIIGVVTLAVIGITSFFILHNKKQAKELEQKQKVQDVTQQYVLPDEIIPLFPNTVILGDTKNQFLLEQKIPLSGLFVSDAESNIQAKTTGQIETLLVKNGDKVHKGQVLAIIKNDQAQERYQIQKSQVTNAELELTQARKDLEKQKALFNEGFISKAALEQIELTWENRKRQQNQLTQQLQIETKNLGFQKLIAPVSGTISNLSVEVGDIINMNSILMNVVNEDSLVWKTPVNSQAMSQINVGGDAQIHINMNQSEPMIIEMKLKRIDPNQTLYFTLANKEQNRFLTINSLYQGFVSLTKKSVTLAVPEESIYHDEQHKVYKKQKLYDFIMMLDSNTQKTVLVPVKLGFKGIYQQKNYQEIEIADVLMQQKINQQTKIIYNPWEIKEGIHIIAQNI